jgi:hypothetical protein
VGAILPLDAVHVQADIRFVHERGDRGRVVHRRSLRQPLPAFPAVVRRERELSPLRRDADAQRPGV